MAINEGFLLKDVGERNSKTHFKRLITAKMVCMNWSEMIFKF